MKRYTIYIAGKVQGIGFRIAAGDKARELRLKGFARNEPDGSLVIDAEGEERDLLTFLAWCSHGPRGATVKKVSYGASDALRGYSQFAVL
jgi:acylphosphatase